ncbi:MAG: N-acetyltransferase [Roseburia sp.]|nr:N-acetyltransferase [Roseburia sp.]MCM1027961.1 N-acetyltransferase [Roseburia sp.]MCM1098278.1 N-acetyltransferase [Ruminococcus flavefaciens]
MNIYQKRRVLENERFLLRMIEKEDCQDLLKVYSDKNALPFFNSDNCNGDNFYYPTMKHMADALDFWMQAYQNSWFARLSIVDKSASQVIGTVELCLRVSEDAFNAMGILRIDVRSDCEEENLLYDLFSLVTPSVSELVDGNGGVLTKAPIYAVERIKALQRAGYAKSEDLLIGHSGYAYDGYWTIKTAGESAEAENG